MADDLRTVKALARVAYRGKLNRDTRYMETNNHVISIPKPITNNYSYSVINCEELQLSKFGYKSNKRAVAVWLAYSEEQNIIFHSCLQRWKPYDR